MVKIDFDRLAQFRYAIISLVGRDGYPWSTATGFEITRDKNILLNKPVAQFPLADKKVGVLFNHISAIPTGGYTERRYMLIWGKLDDDNGKLRLNPEKLAEWDEKILPFPELCGRAAPQGQKYLESMKRQIAA